MEKLQARLEEFVASDESDESDESASEQQVEVQAETDAPVDVDAGSTVVDVPEVEVPEVPTLNPYRAMALPPVGGRDFYDMGSSPALRGHIQSVVDAEGPVLESVLFKRVARAWGLERTGSRIVERLRGLTPSTVIKTVDGDRTFYWSMERPPADWSGFRVADADESSKRHVDEVALEEVGALMHHILNEAGSTSRQELARIACKMLGMSRMPADAEARAGKALEGLAARGVVLFQGDQVRASL